MTIAKEGIKIKALRECPLFKGMNDEELKELLKCLAATKIIYEKDEFIFKSEEKAVSVGIILTGGAYVIQEDYWGVRTILTYINPGGMFGEAFSCAGKDKLPVSVIAAEKAEIMLIDYRRIVTSCTSACIFHTQLIKNMLRVIAEKNIMLMQKMEHLSKRTTREKLLSYLSAEAIQARNGMVEVPFNRQELADYLCVDRSALSRELSLMQKEGILRYEKNCFELL